MNNPDPSMNFFSGSDLQQMRLRDAKRTKFREYFKLKQEQDKILQQMSSKLAQQQPIPPASLPAHQRSRSSTSLQQQKPHLPTTNSTYVVNCIVRALKSRKLAIVDISEIFVVEPEIVEEIDRFRRLKEFQKGHQVRRDRKGEKKKKELMLERLERSIRNAENMEGRTGGSNQSFTSNCSLSKQKRKSRSLVSNPNYQSSTFPHQPFYTQPQHPTQSNFPQPQFSTPFPSHPTSSSQDLLQHQLLLRNKPPYKLDQKTIAIVDLIKKQPNLLQKDMIQVLADEYGIKGVTQTSISRYMKRIYEMKKHVEVLVQAQKDGFVVF